MRRLPLPALLATGAVAWGGLLMLAAFVVPAYSGEDVTSTPGGGSTVTHTTATLVEMNGAGVVWIIAGLIAIAVLAWVGLHRRCAAGSRAGGVVGWACAALVAGFSLISFGLGLWTLPMAGLMLAAAARTPLGARRRA